MLLSYTVCVVAARFSYAKIQIIIETTKHKKASPIHIEDASTQIRYLLSYHTI